MISLRQPSAPPRAHVLLVDDEPTLARVLGLVLTSAGYTVTCCTDGVEALRMFYASPEKVDVIVSDVTMPRISGPQLARAVHQMQPGVPVILMTGANADILDRDRELGVAAVLQKPVGIDDLVGAVDAVFERARLEA